MDADFIIESLDGRRWTITPQNDRAREWVDEDTACRSYDYTNSILTIDHSEAGTFCEAAIASGLAVRVL